MIKKKDEKRSVGRPKLADTDLKKKSLIMSVSCAILIVFLLAGSLVSLNILPKFGKMKGEVTCTEIPARFRPYDAQTNPEGLHEYGFEDLNFYSAVVSSISNNTSCDITKDQLASITNISASNKGITSANGIQYLSNLTYLNLRSNQLTSIDLSQNPDLTALDLSVTNGTLWPGSGNKITNIDLSHNEKLRSAQLQSNLLEQITLGNKPYLTDLNISYNQLTNIDLSKSQNLIYVNAEYNNLNNIDICNNISLESLNLKMNNLQSINLKNNALINYLAIGNNLLTEIDLTNNKYLTKLHLENYNSIGGKPLLNRNVYSNLDLTQNKALITLDLSNTQLTNIDLSHNTSLTQLYLQNNKLSNIDVSQNTGLQELSLSNNKLSSIDLSQNEKLEYLSLSNNILSSIDLSQNEKLEYLYLDNNKLMSINLNNFSKIKFINLSNNFTQHLKPGERKNITNNYILSSDLELTSYTVDDENIARIENDKIVGLNSGSTILNATYTTQENNSYIVPIKISVYDINSSKYTINFENNTIDIQNNVLGNDGYVYINSNTKEYLQNSMQITPSNYHLVYSGDVLGVYDNNYKKIDEYSPVNYKLYGLTSSYLEIEDEIQEINANGYPLQAIADKISIYPYNYKRVLNGTNLEIKDNKDNLLDIYAIKNTGVYKLESSTVNVDEKLKKINANKNVLNNISNYISIYPNNYKKVVNGNNLEIRDNNDNLLDTYEVLNYVNYRLESYYNYTVNYEDNTVDFKGQILENINSFYAQPSGYTATRNGTTIELKDPSGNVVDTYEIINYSIYTLTNNSSAGYVVDRENKTIDIRGQLLASWNVSNGLNLQPSKYRKEVVGNKLYIKDQNNEILDTYTITNYKLYDISVNTNYYSIDTTGKTIDARGNIYSTNYIYFNNPNGFSYETTNDKYIIKDKDGNVVDTYTIINAMESNFDSESTLGIGKEFYTKCVQTSKYPGAIGTYPMTKEEVEGITRLYCGGRNISDTTGLEKLTNLESLGLYDNNIISIDVSKNTKLTDLELYDNNLSSITGLDKLTELTYLDLENNNLTSVDISKNKLLETIYLSGNNLSDALDLSDYENLTSIYLSNNKFTNVKLPKNKDITYIDLRNNQLTSIDLSYYDNLEELYLNNNELTNLILPKTESLRRIYISNNKLTNLDISNNPNIEELYLDHNKLSKIEGIENVESLGVLVAHDNNFSSLDLSHNTNLNAVLLQKNPLYKGIYMLPGTELEYNKYVSFYNAVTYEMDENEYVEYEDGMLKALKEGSSTIYMYVDNMMTMDDAAFDLMMYCNDLDSDTEEYQNKCANRDDSEGEQAYIIANKIVVYDISSDKYDIDKSKKTIDAKKEDIDVNSISISEGLTIRIDGTNMLVMDGEEVAEVYTILNPKEEVKPSIKLTTPKVVNKNTKNDTEKKEEVKEDKNIYLEGNHVSVFKLKEIKGTDRNIVVTSGIFKFTINGKDITDITVDIDLKATIDSLTDSKLNNEIKERIESGLVLDFNSNNNLPGKVKVEINISKEMMETLDNKVNIYTYKDNIFGLIAKDMEIRNNKVSFYVEKLGYYVITSDKVKEGTYNDNDLIRVNKVLNKKEVKKSNINIILIIILLIGVISGISYVLITKKNKNNKSNKKSKKKSKKKKK